MTLLTFIDLTCRIRAGAATWSATCRKQQLKQQLKQLKRLKGLKAEAKILMLPWPVGTSAMRGFTKVQESSTGICLSCLKLLRFEDMWNWCGNSLLPDSFRTAAISSQCLQDWQLAMWLWHTSVPIPLISDWSMHLQYKIYPESWSFLRSMMIQGSSDIPRHIDW